MTCMSKKILFFSISHLIIVMTVSAPADTETSTPGSTITTSESDKKASSTLSTSENPTTANNSPTGAESSSSLSSSLSTTVPSSTKSVTPTNPTVSVSTTQGSSTAQTTTAITPEQPTSTPKDPANQEPSLFENMMNVPKKIIAPFANSGLKIPKTITDVVGRAKNTQDQVLDSFKSFFWG
ncbi:hypothetical protein K1T71_011747 [Dendrolimus kikuchii]|uniref:Uncharacterized protein n=1 Tax=Dendrolimus kikuchii TaxID=765133 RepID=A0ACC1CLY7_9NEOP|nr:hypothetical protein K1T71_011747 [Dendrolimus kikuchii]